MAYENNVEPKIGTSGTEEEAFKKAAILPAKNATIEERLEELESLPHRNPILHWAAFILSLFSLMILATWVFSSRGPVPIGWVLVDIGLGVILAVEFFTRSGFRWDGVIIYVPAFSMLSRLFRR